jgi:hypothetical protein
MTKEKFEYYGIDENGKRYECKKIDDGGKYKKGLCQIDNMIGLTWCRFESVGRKIIK